MVLNFFVELSFLNPNTRLYKQNITRDPHHIWTVWAGRWRRKINRITW